MRSAYIPGFLTCQFLFLYYVRSNGGILRRIEGVNRFNSDQKPLLPGLVVKWYDTALSMLGSRVRIPPSLHGDGCYVTLSDISHSCLTKSGCLPPASCLRRQEAGGAARMYINEYKFEKNIPLMTGGFALAA